MRSGLLSLLLLAALPAIAGEIVVGGDGELVVATGRGALGILALQLPGRRVTTAADFLNAWRGSPLRGQRLGS